MRNHSRPTYIHGSNSSRSLSRIRDRVRVSLVFRAIHIRALTDLLSVHSGVQLLSLYHDSLLAKAMALHPASKRHTPTPHNRYTKFWTERSPMYKRIALVLQMIQYTELLWEMAAKRKGEKVRWRVVILLEVVKAVCRLLLLRLTKSRPLLSPPLPQREVDPSTLENANASADGMDTPPSEGSVEMENWSMPRTGLSLPSLPDSSDISNYLLSKVLTADDIKPPKALLHRVSGKGELAEILYILRPVAYALALQHFSGDRKSWRPWLIGVSIEYGARQLAKKDFQERRAGGLRGLSCLEKEELRKRGWALGWWAMRGAFYENITKYVNLHSQKCAVTNLKQGLDTWTDRQASQQTTSGPSGRCYRRL